MKLYKVTFRKATDPVTDLMPPYEMLKFHNGYLIAELCFLNEKHIRETKIRLSANAYLGIQEYTMYIFLIDADNIKDVPKIAADLIRQAVIRNLENIK